MSHLAAMRARAVNYARAFPEGRGFMTGRCVRQDHLPGTGQKRPPDEIAQAIIRLSSEMAESNRLLSKTNERLAEIERNMPREVTICDTSFNSGEIAAVGMRRGFFSNKVIVDVHCKEPKTLFFVGAMFFYFPFTLEHTTHSFAYESEARAKADFAKIEHAISQRTAK